MSPCNKNCNTSIQSPLGKAKGLGSAHEGVHHWMMQRVTAIANLPLVLWMVYSIFSLQGATYVEFTTWLAQPLNAVLSILFILSIFYHAVLGCQVVVEDYISCRWFRLTKLIGMKLFFTALAVACIFSVLKIAFTAGV
jgi:succinate dehydrogenase / fumarate reductase membrane anchor subunit